MANKIRNLHRPAGSGGAGSPGSVADSGVIAINFDTGGGTKELWASDGTTWHRLNPAGSVPYATSAQVIAGTATSVAIDPATLAAAASSTGGAGSANKYVRFDANGLLDTAVFDYATSAELLANAGTGTVNGIVNDDVLAKSSTVASAGVADASKFVRLDSNGKIDPSVLNVDAMEFKGGADVTAAAPASPGKGDVYIATTGGTAAGSWTGIAGNTVGAGDQLIFDGANWVQVVGTDTTAYVPLAGTSGVAGAAMAAGSVITFNPTTSGDVVLNGATAGNFGALDRVVVDCGTF